METIKCGGAGTVDEGCVAQEGNVVEAEVPNRGVYHAVARESEHGTDDSSSQDIVPVVVLVDRECTANEASTKDRRVDGDELPHGRVVVGKHLEFCVEVAVQEYKASECGRGVSRRHALKRIIDLLFVTCADAAVVHDLTIPVSGGHVERRELWFADGQEMGTEASNQPLDENLEHSSRDETVQQANSRIIDIPEASDANLTDQEDGERDEERQESSGPDWDDFVAHRVCEVGVDNLSVLESNWEAPTRRRLCHVHTQANGAQDSHTHDIQRCGFDPLAEGRARVPCLDAIVGWGFIAAAEDPGFLRVSASSSCSIGVHRRSAAVEEPHCELWRNLC